MNPIDAPDTNPPYLHGGPLGSAAFKTEPADFLVEEILGFEPSGEGEHCFLWIQKTGHNSNDVAGILAERAGVRKRLVSHCGLKDRHATTRQWFSIHLPGQESPPAEQLEVEGLRVLRSERSNRKLRRGSHDGNRFTIRLRNPQFSPNDAEARWAKIAEHGVPNYFGEQRFGRDGDNVAQARKLFAGQIEVRDRLLRGIFLSAARSYLFNTCVATRVLRGDWNRVLEGEVFGFAENRSLVLPDNLRGDEADRVAKNLLELTAPLWGQGDLQSLGEVRSLENEITKTHPDLTRGLEDASLRQERRVIRLHPRNAEIKWHGKDFQLRFNLPKGTYATTVLRELAILEQPK